MIQYETHLGQVTISQSYFAKLVGEAVSSCYGVVAMVPNVLQKLLSRLSGRKGNDAGIRVTGNAQSLTVDVHIQVMHGMNMNAISRSIIHKVSYVIEEATGITVDHVRVHVDGVIDE